MREVLTYRLSDATKITLRPARPDDAAAIIAAVRSSAQERSYVLMEVYGKDAATQRAYIERLDREHNLFLVATVNEQIVGILALLDSLLCSTPEPALSVGVHIVRDWRGRGIGSAMLRYAMRWAKEHGYHRLGRPHLHHRRERRPPRRKTPHPGTVRRRLQPGRLGGLGPARRPHGSARDVRLKRTPPREPASRCRRSAPRGPGGNSLRARQALRNAQHPVARTPCMDIDWNVVRARFAGMTREELLEEAALRADDYAPLAQRILEGEALARGITAAQIEARRSVESPAVETDGIELPALITSSDEKAHVQELAKILRERGSPP